MDDSLWMNAPAGDAELIRAEALGEPGHRRFRLIAVVDGQSYIMWLEKQQLQALALAIEHVFETMGRGDATWVDPGIAVDQMTDAQFRVGRLELAYDQETNQLIISAYDLLNEDEAAPPTLSVRLTRAMGHALAMETAGMMKKGRPICPMCGQPMDIGAIHVCPEQNGHLPILFDEDVLWPIEDEG